MQTRLQSVLFPLAALLLAVTTYAQTGTPTVHPALPGLAPSQGTDLDQVLAIVNGDLILDSDLDQERRFEDLQPYREATASSTRERMLERLIDRDLILQQSRLQPEDAVDDADVTKEIDELRRSIPACRESHCETADGWHHYLATHGFTEAEFHERWRERMQVLSFIEQRFRMGIRIPQSDIEAYYRNTLLPQYAAKHATAPPLTAVSDRIQEVLLSKQVSNLLRDWLKSLRAQGNVVVLHPGEDAP